MNYNYINDINKKLSLLSLDANNGCYSYIKEAIPKELCEKLSNRIWDNIFNVGNSRFSIRLINHGKDFHPSSFLEGRVGDGLIDHINAIDTVIVRELNRGGTFVLDHANEHIKDLQLIQEYIENILGCKCWIQCYITKSEQSAFNMHADDHAFCIIQLLGEKLWEHDESEVANGSVQYKQGDIAFYNKGKKHNVVGLGLLSMHLTIAFEGFDNKSFYDLSIEERKHIINSYPQRVGTSMPYSIDTEMVNENISIKLASRFSPIVEETETSLIIATKFTTTKIPIDFKDAILWMGGVVSTTPEILSKRFGINLNRCLEFVRFGLCNGLFLVANNA